MNCDFAKRSSLTGLVPTLIFVENLVDDGDRDETKFLLELTECVTPVEV